MYLIPEDVNDWYNLRSLKPFLSSPEKKKTTTTTTTAAAENWPGDENKHEHFCSLKANSLETGTKHKNDRLCL